MMNRLPYFRASLICLLVALFTCAAQAQTPKPLWDMKKLSKAPSATFSERKGLIQEVYYEGEPLQGKPTRVFAYYARPEGKGPFPGMVLVHGGGGKAFSEWAQRWAERGYAAIAMDLSGIGPNGKLSDGGPSQDDGTKFRAFTDSDARDMWTYHSVAAAIRAHSLLREQPEVDKNKIGLTGISWGGYLTCIIAGIDHRFKAAVPVYGCGFLRDNSAWKKGILDAMPREQSDQWVQYFDPSNYLPSVRCPILFLNGTNDFAYPMDSYKKSYSLVRSPKWLSVQIRLPHGHIFNFGIVEAFIDSYLKSGTPLPRLSQMTAKDGRALATLTSKSQLTKAELYYTTDKGEWQTRKWEALPADIDGNYISARLPTVFPLTHYLAVTDAAGNIVTTQHEEKK